MSPSRVELFESTVSDRTKWLFVRIETPDGHVGYGECSDGGGDVAQLFAALFAPLSNLTSVNDPHRIAGTVNDTLVGETELAARTIVGGIEQAFCDLAARRCNKPLWQWLGATAKTDLPLYANINRVPGGRRPEDVAMAGAAAVADGFHTVKCAPFDTPLDGLALHEAGVARLRALRRAVGPEVSIYVDCHERVPLADVLSILPELTSLDVAWLEDATACTDLDGLAQLQAASTIPLAGGEMISTVDEVKPAVERDLLHIVMPDVKHAGGLLRSQSITRALPRTRISPHNPSGPIGTATTAHLAAGLPNFTLLEYAHGEAAWRSEIVRGSEHVRDGQLHLVDGPGIGLDLALNHPSLQRISSLTVEEK